MSDMKQADEVAAIAQIAADTLSFAQLCIWSARAVSAQLYSGVSGS